MGLTRRALDMHRTYVSQDVVRRVLEEHCGRPVFFVMGVTDVDDKIIARARAK
jgi:cysteinyl-tRNA synthetase